MVDGTVSVDSLANPLADLSFIPETLGGTSAISDRDWDHMDSIRTCFKSLALSNPQKLLEQAKTIVDNGSGLLNVKIPSPIASEEKYEAVPVLMDVKSPSTIAPKAKYGVIPVHINLRNHKPEEKITAGPVQAHQNLHEQRAREGLGRKRARFSLKPNSSLLSAWSLVWTLINCKTHPAEFFLAYERIENAKKELQKQNGAISMDSGLVNSFRATRQRRPGLLGRSASFRHGNSSIAAHEDGSFISSQETFQLDIHSQQSTDIGVALLENEFPDSAAKAKKNAHNLVDELLFKKCEGLEGDGVVNFVKEVLQIKPIDVAKVKSPLHDVQRNECTVLEGYLPIPRNPLFHLKNGISGLSNRKAVKCKNVGDTIVDIPASSTSPKSPSVSSDSTPMRYSPIRGIHDQPDWINIKKELSVSGNLKRLIHEEGDTRSAKSGDTSQHGISNVSTGSHGKPENDMDDYNMKDLYTDNSSVRPENDVEENWHSESYNLRNEIQSGFINDMVVDGNSSRPEADSDVCQNEHTGWYDPGNHVASYYVSGMATDCHTMKLHSDVQINECSLLHDPQDEMMDTDSNRQKADSNVNKIENSELCDSAEGLVGGYRKDMFVDNASRPEIDFDAQTNEHSKSHEKVECMPHDTAVSALSVENLNDNCILSSQLSPAVEPSTANGPSKTADINIGQPIQKIQEPVLEQKKGKNPTHRKRKVSRRECQKPMLQLEEPKEQKKGRQSPRKREVSGRKSLQGAGMLWQSGVRRSTRIKSRPLEYWKGERFLYGRVHQSLTTVIGVKYASPSKGKGEPTLRVKSYVSDEYKELDELAALH